MKSTVKLQTYWQETSPEDIGDTGYKNAQSKVSGEWLPMIIYFF